MAFVADDLAAWLMGSLASAGRTKLTSLIVGNEQERALRAVATAAVQLTARELRPDDDAQAEYLALVISEVFGEPVAEASLAEHQSGLEALRVGVAKQLAVLDDADLTGQGQSSAEVLGVSGTVLAEKLTGHLLQEITARGSRGGPLAPLANRFGHDATHLQARQVHRALRQVGSEILGALGRLEDAQTTGRTGSQSTTEVVPHVEQLLDGLGLGEDEEAERRVNRLFLYLRRDQQRAAVEAIIRVATTTKDHTSELIACSLLEAADPLDPMLVTTEEVDGLARSAEFSLRSSAAALMWQWAESVPDRVPIPLLGKLAQPSGENWYVHAVARAGAKQLLLRRAPARLIFDRMAASRDRDDRDYAVADLLEVAMVEPRAVPADLAQKLAGDRIRSVAARATKLVRALDGIAERDRRSYYGPFGL